MQLPAPVIDDRRYQQLVDEMLARVPVHTPEWTNFNHSDPGVTLVQLFAFLAENVLYRANRVPERNQKKFLELLGVPLSPAAAASGLITIINERGPLQTATLPDDIEVRAGPVSFRTTLGLDVLPVEAHAFIKRSVAAPDQALIDYYSLLYASYGQQLPPTVSLYETVAFDGVVVSEVDLLGDTVDRSVWIALTARKGDERGNPADPWRLVREALGGRTLSLGIVPSLDVTQVVLTPGAAPTPGTLLAFEMPRLATDPAGAKVTLDANGDPAPTYRALDPRADVDVLRYPGVVQLTLPPAAEIGMWQDLDPLEVGVGDLPPMLNDTDLADRLVTWIRIRATGASAVFLWAGVNAAPVKQREHVFAEPLQDGDGTPDQTRRLARAPVLPQSVAITSLDPAGPPGSVPPAPRSWSEIDDMFAAGPEVVVPDDRLPPTPSPPPPAPTDVFTLDPGTGTITFGDGLHGRRPAAGTRLFAQYDFCQGAAGNVAAGAIGTAPALSSGLTVVNPVRTWGGTDAETVAEGERQVPRMLQHRDRLVSTADFVSIAWRAPGVDLGRVEVLPAFHPDLNSDPGSAPGVVTVMAIPRVDPTQPDAPQADRPFLNALCAYLDPRRLVTTELVLRGPTYKGIWISVGVDVASGFSVADVVQAVKQRLQAFLTPLPADAGDLGFVTQAVPLLAASQPAAPAGWPLRTAVSSRVLLAEAARVAGVTSVADVLLAEGTLAAADIVEMTGLELPRILGLSVVSGDPVPIGSLRGDGSPVAATGVTTSVLPVPIIPAGCQ